MTPKDDTRKLGRGGLSKGPARRPASNSFEILALTISGFCCAEIRLFAKKMKYDLPENGEESQI